MRLSISAGPWMPCSKGVESTVQFELAEDEGGTLVTLSQSDLPGFALNPGTRDCVKERSQSSALSHG